MLDIYGEGDLENGEMSEEEVEEMIEELIMKLGMVK
ncbi:pyruvate formate lyase family protein, partial [Staphylococcus epidermidis]